MSKTFRKVISAVLMLSILLTGILTLTGCGNSPEKVAEGAYKAMLKGDAKKLLSYMPDKFVDYILEEEFDGDKDEMLDSLEEVFEYINEFYEENDVDAKDIKVKATDVEDMDEDEIDDLNADYEDCDIKIKDAKIVEIEVTYEMDGDEETDEEEITVIKVGSKWYIGGDF